MSDDRNRQYDLAKRRMVTTIATVWRVYDSNGELLPEDEFREDFDAESQTAINLSDLWLMLSSAQQLQVRETIERPSTGVGLPSGKSWQDYDEMVLGLLENGETVKFGEEH